jgi:hypothetical protein
MIFHPFHQVVIYKEDKCITERSFQVIHHVILHV